MSFLDIVSKFNQQADSHSKSQSLNPFSEQFEQSRSPSPRFSREDYGKPVAGSKTDLRGRKAKTHICREILELCTVIHDVGTYNAKKRNPDDDSDDNEDDGTIIVSFGELFQIYTKISDKVVGLLIAAKRRGFVYFDREILFQRRDDDVLIALLKPISEINKILKDDISQTNAPSPVELKPAEKKKSSSSGKTKRVKPECNDGQTIDNSTTTVDPTNVLLEVTGDAAAEVKNDGETDGQETKCDEGTMNVGGVVEGIAIGSEEMNRVGEIADGGEAVTEIGINNGENSGDDDTRGEDVVRTKEANNAGRVSEGTELENTRNPVEDEGHESVIGEDIKTVDVNGHDRVIEDRGKDADLVSVEKIEKIRDGEFANNFKVNLANESEGVSFCGNGIEKIGDGIEHLIPIVIEK